VGKRQRLFSLQTTIGTDDFSLNGLYFASWMLQDSLFLSFVRLLWVIITLALLYAAFPCLVKKEHFLEFLWWQLVNGSNWEP